MESVEETLRIFRESFVRSWQERLTQMEQLLDRLGADASDLASLEQLCRHFHGLAGGGGTYGFPLVSEISTTAEIGCRRAIEEKIPPTVAQLADWRGKIAPLRAALGSAPQAAAPALAPSPPAPKPHDLLIVEDDPEVVAALSRVLEREGFAVRTAGSVAAARQEVARRVPEALLVDVGLPDESGYALVESVRALAEGESAGILIISGLGGFLDKVEAIHCGADGFFQKPIDKEALVRRLRHLVGRNQSEAARVLSVEDDSDQAAYLSTILESAGYEVRICSDPKHFEADLAAFRPDIVLMDINLPGTSGYELARYVRQEERFATLPVLFLTTEGEMATRIASARAGGDEHLVKPIAPALLLSAVAARVERGRFTRSLRQHDGLTGLLTHTEFFERVKAVVAEKRRPGTADSTLVAIDLDRFAKINDAYGDRAGDRVLAALSTLLRRRLRHSDTFGRLGGDTFAVLLRDLGGEEAVRLIDRLRADFAASEHSADGTSFRATFSAGVAPLESSTTSLKAWRRKAATALSAAKAIGRNRVVLAAHRG